MIRLVEVYREKDFGINNGYRVRQVYINPVHVVCMYEDPSMLRNLREGFLPEDLDERQTFTRLHLNQGQSVRQMTVVGSVGITSEKLGLSPDKRKLLHD